MDYKKAGVDIDAGNETVKRIRGFAKSTLTPGVLSSIGSFGGLFRLGDGYHDPVLVSSADGVGTKLKLAFMTGRHGTVGQDLVNHCVNDILVQGAIPLFFLDYLATGRLEPDVAAQVIEGVAVACRENGCALIGGETAEMPGFYQEGEYDIAGFIVGVVERDRLVTGGTLEPGHTLIGVPSTGLHTNGYSLARAICFDHLGLSADTVVPELGASLADVLLRVHRSYLPLVRPLLDAGVVRGLAHITGGGITENLPRILPDGTGALIDKSTWTPLPVFRFLGERGGVPEDEMYRSFNMGIGLIIGCADCDVSAVFHALEAGGEDGARVIGRVVAGGPGVTYGRI